MTQTGTILVSHRYNTSISMNSLCVKQDIYIYTCVRQDQYRNQTGIIQTSYKSNEYIKKKCHMYQTGTIQNNIKQKQCKHQARAIYLSNRNKNIHQPEVVMYFKQKQHIHQPDTVVYQTRTIHTSSGENMYSKQHTHHAEVIYA